MNIIAKPTVKASTALWATHYLAFGLLYRCGGSDRIFTIFPKLMSNQFLIPIPLDNIIKATKNKTIIRTVIMKRDNRRLVSSNPKNASL